MVTFFASLPSFGIARRILLRRLRHADRVGGAGARLYDGQSSLDRIAVTGPLTCPLQAIGGNRTSRDAQAVVSPTGKTLYLKLPYRARRQWRLDFGPRIAPLNSSGNPQGPLSGHS